MVKLQCPTYKFNSDFQKIYFILCQLVICDTVSEVKFLFSHTNFVGHTHTIDDIRGHLKLIINF